MFSCYIASITSSYVVSRRVCLEVTLLSRLRPRTPPASIKAWTSSCREAPGLISTWLCRLSHLLQGPLDAASA